MTVLWTLSAGVFRPAKEQKFAHLVQDTVCFQSNKELMELFFWSTRNVIEPLGFEISILGYQFVLETTLLFLDLHILKD